MLTTAGMQYRYDFLKYRYAFLALSLLYLLVGAVGYIVRGGFDYHVEFTGGAEVRIAFDQSVDIGQIRQAMSTQGWKDMPIQSIGRESKEFILRINSAGSNIESEIKNTLSQEFPSNKSAITSITSVGPEVGKDTTWNALKAVVLALIVLLLYIAVRFEFQFGVGAVVALGHDLLSILIFLLLTGEPVSLNVLAAVLTILGYSINDTIVIFSRIRENMVKLPGVSGMEIANISINQTLTRTLLTSMSTLVSVATILILGGEALRPLSLVLFIGIIVGTYSSIYIASPVMLAVGKLFNR